VRGRFTNARRVSSMLVELLDGGAHPGGVGGRQGHLLPGCWQQPPDELKGQLDDFELVRG